MGFGVLYFLAIIAIIIVGIVAQIGAIFITILVIHLIGAIIAFPLAIHSEQDYKDRDRYRPLRHALLYSWIYLYVFIKNKNKAKK